MKLREVESFSHGTSFVVNFTHPVPVSSTLLSFGIGTIGISLVGGVNTADIVSPVKNPTNIQNTENIITLYTHLNNFTSCRIPV